MPGAKVTTRVRQVVLICVGLLLLTWVLLPAALPERRAELAVSSTPTTTPPPPLPSSPLLPGSPFFGLSMAHIPYDVTEAQAVAASVACQPLVLEFFHRIGGRLDPIAFVKSQRAGAIPMLSLEPWESGAAYTNTLGMVLDGHWDEQFRTLARDIAAFRYPVMLRYAHEFNGSWYPWGEGAHGNAPGAYVRAWRHVVDLFEAEGATNALWVWSPNILRGTDETRDLATMFPGRDYVDVVGLTGYGVDGEATPADTYDATLAALAPFTAGMPTVMTEMGVYPSALKEGWIAALGPWLRQHPEVMGVIWFEMNQLTGANADWRFSDTPENLAAMAQTLIDGNVRCYTL